MAFRCTAIFAAFLFWPTSSIAADDRIAAIKADCKLEWPNDFAMQEYCLKRQVEAINKLALITQTEKNEDLHRALAACLGEWKTTNGNDWAMVHYCYTRQEAAYRRLNQ